MENILLYTSSSDMSRCRNLEIHQLRPMEFDESIIPIYK